MGWKQDTLAVDDVWSELGNLKKLEINPYDIKLVPVCKGPYNIFFYKENIGWSKETASSGKQIKDALNSLNVRYCTIAPKSFKGRDLEKCHILYYD